MSDIRLVFNAPPPADLPDALKETWPDVGRACFLEPLDHRLPDETDDAYHLRVMAEAGRAKVPFRVVHVKDIPDAVKVPFRDAWTVDRSGKIVTHLPTARRVHKRHLERHREQHIAKLSAHVAIADDDDDKHQLKALKAKRKAARELDLDAALAKVKTVEELAAFVPVELT